MSFLLQSIVNVSTYVYQSTIDILLRDFTNYHWYSELDQKILSHELDNNDHQNECSIFNDFGRDGHLNLTNEGEGSTENKCIANKATIEEEQPLDKFEKHFETQSKSDLKRLEVTRILTENFVQNLKNEKTFVKDLSVLIGDSKLNTIKESNVNTYYDNAKTETDTLSDNDDTKITNESSELDLNKNTGFVQEELHQPCESHVITDDMRTINQHYNSEEMRSTQNMCVADLEKNTQKLIECHPSMTKVCPMNSEQEMSTEENSFDVWLVEKSTPVSNSNQSVFRLPKDNFIESQQNCESSDNITNKRCFITEDRHASDEYLSNNLTLLQDDPQQNITDYTQYTEPSTDNTGLIRNFCGIDNSMDNYLNKFSEDIDKTVEFEPEQKCDCLNGHPCLQVVDMDEDLLSQEQLQSVETGSEFQ